MGYRRNLRMTPTKTRYPTARAGHVEWTRDFGADRLMFSSACHSGWRLRTCLERSRAPLAQLLCSPAGGAKKLRGSTREGRHRLGIEAMSSRYGGLKSCNILLYCL